MSTGQNDTEIINRVLGGDQQAYGLLVSKYQGYAFTLALRMVKSREDAEELAQDAFIKAFKFLADFKGESKFSTWLYTIVNNTCITFLRKKRPDIHSLDNEKVFELADSRDTTHATDRIEAKSRQAIVNEAIAMLSPDDARVITLFYKAEQSLEETALILGIETNAAKVRLHRARTRLKDKMETHFAQEIG
jgi:RNA polymerase sigma factor (sigma-70 family)